MATPSALRAQEVLEWLAKTRGSYVLLHGEKRIASGDRLTDVDVGCADVLVCAAMAQILQGLESLGLGAVLAWRYDARSVTLFLCGAGPSDGVQLDLDCDPKGLGRYGIRTGVAFSASRPGLYCRVLADEDERLYLLAKRLVKRQSSEVRMLASIDESDRVRLQRRARQLFRGRVARRLERALAFPQTADSVRVPVRVPVARIGWRLVCPAGIVVFVDVSQCPEGRVKEVLDCARSECSALLPEVVLVGSDANHQIGWTQRIAVAAAKRKATLTLVVGGRTPARACGVDAVVRLDENATGSELAADIVQQMKRVTKFRLLEARRSWLWFRYC